MKSLRTLIVLLIVNCINLAACVQPAQASPADTSCGIIWDSPILLSDTSHNAYSPHVALSGDDTVHIVWFGGGTRLPYRRSANGGQGFEPTTELLADSIAFPFDANMPSVVAWQQNVYVFFQGATPGIYSPVRMVKSTTGGVTWQYPVDISPDTTGPPPLTPTILGDTIAMTYVPRRQVTNYILRSTNAGVAWQSINAALPTFSRFAFGSRAALSPGVLHMVQHGGTASVTEVEYRRSTDLGDTWIQQGVLSTIDQFWSDLPVIGSDGDSTIITAWREAKHGCLTIVGCGIDGRWSLDAGASFGDEMRFDAQPAGIDATAAAKENTLAVGWRDDLDGFVKARISRNRGVTWCEPITASHIDGGVPQFALSGRAIHIVWASGNGEPDNRSRIFYRRGVFKTTSVENNPPTIPDRTTLAQNYPNPFNPSTTITYRISKAALVSLRVYDMLGREVAVLVNGRKEAGEHTSVWNAGNVSAGMYYYRLITSDRIETRKAIVLK